jgi:hypothetical protein
MREHETAMGVKWTQNGYRLSGEPPVPVKKEAPLSREVVHKAEVEKRRFEQL